MTEQDVRNLSEHGVSQILHHQAHPMSLGPAKREHGPGLGLAGLEGDPVPPQFPSQADVLPIMSAFVHKERFSIGQAMHWNPMHFEVVGKGLFDV